MLLMFKKINWTNIGTIVLVAAITALFIVPFLRPIAKKVPFVGGYAE